MKSHVAAALLASACLAPFAPRGAYAAAADFKIDADDIAGVVTSAKGPEAGVWVIAEATDLPTKFSRTVVTDEQGRYVVPDLPKANYKIWVRGYGLVDSKPVAAAPGKTIDLSAAIAPDRAAAAQYYPPVYWASMIRPPEKREFPGTGPNGNGIAPGMTSQQDWTHMMAEGCMICHQLGDKATRTLVQTGNSVEAWEQRIQLKREGDMGLPEVARQQKISLMGNYMTRFGRQRALAMFADWTDRIAKGELPQDTPSRPQGIERNVVVTVRDFGSGHFTHDHVSSSRQNANVNAGGPIYGLATNHATLEVLDPVTNTTKSLTFPGPNGEAVDKTVGVHHVQMDDRGRVWIAGGSQLAPMPSYCYDGSTPFSKYYPSRKEMVGADVTEKRPEGGHASTVPMYDPATGKMEHIVICNGGGHITLGWDKDRTAYLGTGASMSWIKTKVWDETHDAKKAQGWCPLVLDTNGDGKIDPDRTKWNEWGKPLDPKKDTLYLPAVGNATINIGFVYGLNVDQTNAVWGAIDNRPYIVRLAPGSNPPETCMAELYSVPKVNGAYEAFSSHGMSVDSQGVAWVAYSSGHLGRFDRRKCKVLNGPTATGEQCPEGWKVYTLPGPLLSNTKKPLNYVYGAPPDFDNTMGLGKDALFLPSVNSNSVIAFEPKAEKFFNLAIPYPEGFYPRDTHYRIDDPKTGWKGRGLTAAFSEIPPWHQEEGEGSQAKIAQIQLRPNPLAH